MSEAPRRIYGLMAEFREPEHAAALTRRLRQDGFYRFEVYSPLPIDDLDMPPRPWSQSRLVLVMFLAAFVGGFGSFLMQYLIAAVAFPLNVGGRPLNSWPAFVPISWEICALFTVCSGFLAFLIACHLPQLYHPIFAAPDFARASQDRIVICVEASDRHFRAEQLSAVFREAGACVVREVPI